MNKALNLQVLILIIALIALSSCSRDIFLSSTYSSAINSLINFYRENPSSFDRNIIDKIPYASSLISFKDFEKSLIILQKTQDETNYWISSDEIIFKEKEGRIIGTMGLPNDIYSINRPNIDFEEIVKTKAIDYVSYYSFKNPDLNNLKASSFIRVIGLEKITILNREYNTILIEENIYSETINWSVSNKFWVEPEGFFVRKSVQFLSPRLPKVTIEVTKRPS